MWNKVVCRIANRFGRGSGHQWITDIHRHVNGPVRCRYVVRYGFRWCLMQLLLRFSSDDVRALLLVSQSPEQPKMAKEQNKEAHFTPVLKKGIGAPSVYQVYTRYPVDDKPARFDAQ